MKCSGLEIFQTYLDFEIFTKILLVEHPLSEIWKLLLKSVRFYNMSDFGFQIRNDQPLG